MQSRDFVQTQNEEKIIGSCYLHWVPLILKLEYKNLRL
jgi:hypothetical protein